MLGIALRGGVAAVAVLGGFQVNGEVVAINGALLVAGALVVSGSALWDIGTVGRHVRERNERRRTQEASIEPVLLESEGGRPVPGLALRLRF